MTLLIRSAEPRDAEAMVPLLEQLGYGAEASAVRRRLEMLLRREDCAVLVAEDGNRVVGLVSLQVLALLHTDAPRAMLTALVVLDAARGRGVGRALVSKSEEEGRARGCSRVIVTSANQRANAHRFYERLGYSFTGRRFIKELS